VLPGAPNPVVVPKEEPVAPKVEPVAPKAPVVLPNAEGAAVAVGAPNEKDDASLQLQTWIQMLKVLLLLELQILRS